jgi:hypothetical protein
LLLSYALLLTNIVIKLSALHVLKDEYDAVIFLENFIDVDYIGVVQSDKHFDLVLGEQEISLIQFGCKHLLTILSDCALHGTA